MSVCSKLYNLLCFCSAAIVTQPVSTSVELGTTITLSVGVTGYDVFQWFGPGSVMLSDDGRISGANTGRLTITNAISSDSGDYFVDVAAFGTIPPVTEQSNVATVTVTCK